MPETSPDFDASIMRRAIELAHRGHGWVEPNPMVGCVVVKDGRVLSEGYHERFGGPHAEVNALKSLTDEQRAGSTIYITLEPCTHFGKTPPCIDLVLASKPSRVVIGVSDPFAAVDGRGLDRLQAAGIPVELGVEGDACRRLLAPFTKRQMHAAPWIIAKWAMTLDGRMATRTGDSQWITGEAARQHAHEVRGKMDAIIVGIGTALADDPLLTARPPGPRLPARIVIDSRARLPLTSKLVKTSENLSTIIACGPEADSASIAALEKAGCDVRRFDSPDAVERIRELLLQLGSEGCSNVLVDGGPRLLGSLFDNKIIDEVHVYIGRKLVGGRPELVPNLGTGVDVMSKAVTLEHVHTELLDGDIFLKATCS